MAQSLNVVIADSCFDHKGLSNPVMPLGAGLVAAYANHRFPNVSIQVFKAVTPLLEALEQNPPDILGLTCYLWNKNLSVAVAEYAKKIKPNMLIIFGGPEIDSNPEDVYLFKKKYSVVDIFIQHEGEVAFSNVIQKYLDVNLNKVELRRSILELGNSFLINSDNRIVAGPNLKRIEDLDDIPSPYLMGLFDKFLVDPAVMPMIQTNRGCPFSCTFCQEGESYFTKVKRHSLNYTVADLDYIAERVHRSSALWITDSNWAMYKWDEDIAEHIALIQSKIDWPKEIISSTGKANLDRIIKITGILNNTMYISNSVQSMNADVLKEIKRKNLNPLELEKHRDSLQGVRQEPEIIVPLPNETKETFFDGINSLLDSGPNQRFAVFQTLILTNTDMAHGTSISKFGLEVKYKQHYNLIGYVDGKFVCETERVVASTNLISTNQYLECRVYAMLLDTLLRFEPIEEVFRLLDSHSKAYSAFTVRLYESLSCAPEEIRSCIESFKQDLLDEMHDSEADVIEYMQKNEENYKYGKKGGGNFRYSNMLWIDHFSLTLNWIFDTLSTVLEADSEIRNIKEYLAKNYLDRTNLSGEPTVSSYFDYDVKAWSEAARGKPLSDYLGGTTYNFIRTKISDVDALTVWQDFGFKLDKKTAPKPASYVNKLFLSRLRRDVEYVNPRFRQSIAKNKKVNRVGKVAL